MLSTKETAIIYETLLASPGMNDFVKLNLRIQRKNLLLLSKVIELGLTAKDEKGENGILSIADEQTLAELKNVTSDLLTKADLSVMNEKLNSLNAK